MGVASTDVSGGVHVSAAQFGWLVTASGLGGLVGAMISGLVSTRITPARLTAVALGVVGTVVLVEVTIPLFPLGRVVAPWAELDIFGLLQQIGAIPPA